MLCLIAAAAVSVLATSPDQVKTFEQWWAESIARARNPDISNGMAIEWSHTNIYPIPEGGLAAMRERLKNKPDHPDRSMLDMLERQAAKGPVEMQLRTWRLSDGTGARLSFDTSQTGSMIDAAFRADGSWTLVPQTLSLRTANPARPNHNVRLIFSSYESLLEHLTSGGLSQIARSDGGVVPIPVLDQRGYWTARRHAQVGGQDLDVMVEGSFDSTTGTGRVDRMVQRSPGDTNGKTESVTTYEDWRTTPIGSVPHSMTLTMSPGGSVVMIRIKSIQRTDDGFVRTLIADPLPDKPDPIRGPLTFGLVSDERKNDGYAKVINRDGEQIGRSAEPLTPPAKSSTALIVAGWSLAAVVLVYLATSLIRRSKGG
jgi:hypothetical protein